MNWDAIGAVGEIVGAAAVVVSLLYLAVQVKQGINKSASDSGLALVSEFNRFFETILGDPELIEMLVKFQSGEVLSPQDEIRAEYFADRIMNNWWAAEVSHRNGILDDDLYNDMVRDARRFFRSYPPLRGICRQILGNYSEINEMPVFAPIFEDD